MEASSSYADADADATAAKEANVVDNLFESTVRARPRTPGLQAAIACYSRAVAGPEWDPTGEGILRLGPDEMEITAEQIHRDYAVNYSDALPCDDQGRPLVS